MGFRQLPTAPGPAALENPVPLRAEAEQAQDDLQLPEAQPFQTETEADPAAPQIADAQAPAPTERSPAGLTDEEFEELVMGGASPEEIEAMFGDGDSPEKQQVRQVLDNAGFFQKLEERIKVGLPRSDKKRLEVLKKMVGSKNAKLKDGTLRFRRGSKGPWMDFDKEIGTGGLEEFGLDTAELAGDLTEGVISALVEGGMATAGFVVGGPVGAGFGLTAGLAAGPAAGLAARDFISQVATGTEATDDYIGDVAVDTGINLLSFGFGKALKGVGGLTRDFAKELVEGSPMEIIKKSARIRQFVDDFTKVVGVPTGPKKAGDKAFSLIEKKEETLGKIVTMFKQEAKNRSGDQKFVPRDYLKAVGELFTDQGVRVDGRTKIASMVKNETLNLGSGKQGAQALEQVIDNYNDILIKLKQDDGISLDRLFNDAKSLLSGVDFEMQSGGKKSFLNSQLKKLGLAMTSDKNRSMAEALGGAETPTGKLALKAMSDFSNVVSEISNFKKIANSRESGELFVDALIRPGNSERLQAFKNIVGEHSEGWLDFKASWMDKTVRDSIDTTTGIFNASTFIDKVSDKRIGREVRETLLTNNEFSDLRRAAIDFESTGLQNVLNNTPVQNKIKKMMSLMSPFRNARAQGAISLLQSHAKAADYLLDDGFVDLAQASSTRREMLEWLEFRGTVGKIIRNSKRFTKKNGQEIYVSTPIARTATREAISTNTGEDVRDTSKKVLELDPINIRAQQPQE